MPPRIVANLALCVAVFLVPLALHPSKLAAPAPWLGLAVALILLLSQPRLDLREVSSWSARDHGSALAIFAATIATLLVAVMQFSCRTQAPSSWAIAVGAVLATGGLGLRISAIRILGRFFTSTVRVEAGQTVVQKGPYRWLRHPSYTGALMAVLGQVIALESTAGLVLVAGLCVPAYIYRITVEERALISQLGEQYVSYRRRAWGLVPGIR